MKAGDDAAPEGERGERIAGREDPDVADELARLLASRSNHLIRHTKLSFNRVEHMGGNEAYAFEQMHSEILHLRQQA